MVEGRLEDVIDRLLKYASPKGYAYKKLTLYREQMKRNVMLGEGARRYIASLLEKLDNVECRHLEKDGSCIVKRGAYCSHGERYRNCGMYEKPLATSKNPAREIGVES